MGVKMVIDTPNLLFRVAAQNKKVSFGTDEEKAGLALHMAFQTVHKYFKMFRPELLALGFEGERNWRKDYTRSKDAVSKKQYKANRVKDPSMEPYFAMINAFREVITAHSSLMVLQNERLEGDDTIAAFVEKYAGQGDTVIIVSGDRDYIQLLKHPGVRLINPDTGKDRNQPEDKEYWPDIEYFEFQKCIRGDMGDYVFSAYPRVRETKIEKAHQDPAFRANFMAETWKAVDDETNEERTMVVGELFEENKKLLILDQQPPDIRQLMRETVDAAYENIGTYSNFHFLKFLGKHKLNNITEHIDQYTDMLCVNSRFKRKLAGENNEVRTTEPAKKQLLEF
jgi:hypothetical protein